MPIGHMSLAFVKILLKSPRVVILIGSDTKSQMYVLHVS